MSVVGRDGDKALICRAKSARHVPYSQQGFAFLEFALVLPLLIGILVAIIEFSVAMYDKAVLTNAAREGARFGALKSGGSLSELQREAQIRSRVKDYSEPRLITFRSSPSVTPVDVTTATISLGSGQDGLLVRVTYQYQGFLLGPLFSLTMKEPMLLVSEAVMRHEQ